MNLVDRILEAGPGARAANAQVALALAEALEARGAAGQLQARVLRALEAENSRLKQEVLLLGGAETQFSGDAAQAQLRKSLDAFFDGAGVLPGLQARCDFEFALEHAKVRI